MADRYYRKIKKSFDDVKYKLQFTAMELKLKNNENDISDNLKKIETNETDITSNLTKKKIDNIEKDKTIIRKNIIFDKTYNSKFFKIS